MERERISVLAHAEHALAAPVGEARARLLLERLSLPQGGSAVDLGCGRGAWLLLLAAARPDLRLVGVDTSAGALEAARTASAALGAAVEWVQGDAATVPVGRHDAVLCVGASHAFGGLAGTLTAVRERLAPGGAVLLGDGFWDRPPSPAAQEMIGDLPDLAGLVAEVRAHGFDVADGHVSTAEEWDDYEWAWTGALVRWAARQPEGPERTAALAAAREHREDWLTGYRTSLGFATLVLLDLDGA